MNMIKVRNNLTKKFDDHLHDEWKVVLEEGYHEGTYIVYNEPDYRGRLLAIRFNEANQAVVFIDTNDIITKIELIEDNHYYKESLKSIIPDLIGTKLDLSSVKKG